MIAITSDWSAVEAELDRLERLPSGKARQGLKAVMNVGFDMTQAAVHEETGALKASGRVDDEIHHADHVWEGTISYGDDSGPVDYAIYEQRRGVHWAGDSSAKGDHDFFRMLPSLHPLFVMAILMGLKK